MLSLIPGVGTLEKSQVTETFTVTIAKTEIWMVEAYPGPYR